MSGPFMPDVSIVTYPWYESTEAGLTGDREVDRALLAVAWDRWKSTVDKELTGGDADSEIHQMTGHLNASACAIGAVPYPT